MSGFLKSFLPILTEKKAEQNIKKYWLELSLITIAIATLVVSTLLYVSSIEKNKQFVVPKKAPSPTRAVSHDIFVDVSGAVNNPGLYKASESSRLNDLIDLAGGFTDNADRNFFYKNFNLAKIITDQDKIYIPTTFEVTNGYILPENQPQTESVSSANNYSSSKININKATQPELETLPGVGPVTAQKIIGNRPFKALQELVDKKITTTSTFEKIKDLIEI